MLLFIHRFVCTCFLSPGEDSPELAEIKRVNRDLQVSRQEQLVYSGRYDGREDFAAVVQPYFRNTIVPLTADGKPDDSYFSQDCFHFSERGHAEMAIHLWNNMLEPVGEKQSYNIFTNARDRIKCPTEVRKHFSHATADLVVYILVCGCEFDSVFLFRKSKKMKLATVEMKATEF
uniref:Uncharacterized protein n=1 Tax=Amphiprion percula TaxID=161767 RepID=A0A3P8TEW3_AMPPE